MKDRDETDTRPRARIDAGNYTIYLTTWPWSGSVHVSVFASGDVSIDFWLKFADADELARKLATVAAEGARQAFGEQAPT